MRLNARSPCIRKRPNFGRNPAKHSRLCKRKGPTEKAGLEYGVNAGLAFRDVTEKR